MIEGDEGMEFCAGEPQTGQGVVAVCGVVAIAAVSCVEDERCAELVPQVGDEAGEFGAGNCQLVYHCLAADCAAPSIKQAMQPVEVIGFAQDGLFTSNPA